MMDAIVRRSCLLARLFVLVVLTGLAAPLIAQAPPGAALTLLSRDGRRTLPVTAIGSQDYVFLDEVAAAFGTSVQEDKLAGGLTMAVNGRTIVLTADQGVVSVGGRLVSLAAPVVRQGSRWLAPVDFISRALAIATGNRMDLRRASRLLVIGDLRVPRVTVRVAQAGPRTSVVVELSPAAPARVVSPATGRLEVEVDADALDLTLPAFAPQEVLQSIAAGDRPTTVRLVTGPRYGSYRASTEQAGPDTARLTVDLLTQGADTTAPAPPGTAPATPPAAPTAPGTPGTPAAPGAPGELPSLLLPTPTTSVRTVVLDPGHGGDDTGTRGANGTLEKNVTLAIARRLKTLIETRLGLRVFLTRDDDRSLTLDERTAFANNQQADAFISLHANASVRPTLKGAEVSFLSLAQAAPTSAPQVPDIGQTVLPTLSGGMRAIDLVLWENAQQGHLERSSVLANFVDQSLRSRVEMSPRGVQQEPLRVLVGANMPAVLVETGYLSHPQQEAMLASADGQARLAEGLLEALVHFRDQLDRAAAAAGPGQ